MRELRDGATSNVSDEVRERRAAQISELQVEHARLVALIADLDRYRAHAQSAPVLDPTLIEQMDRAIWRRVVDLTQRADATVEAIATLKARLS